MPREIICGENARRLKEAMRIGHPRSDRDEITVEYFKNDTVEVTAWTPAQNRHATLRITPTETIYTSINTAKEVAYIWKLTYPGNDLSLTKQEWTYARGIIKGSTPVEPANSFKEKQKTRINSMIADTNDVLARMADQSSPKLQANLKSAVDKVLLGIEALNLYERREVRLGLRPRKRELAASRPRDSRSMTKTKRTDLNHDT